MIELKHFSKSVIGLVRKANEDSIGSLDNKQTSGNGSVFVVCDGMGGHVGGAFASKTAVDCILQYFQNNPHPNPVIALEKAISFANEQIFGHSQKDPSLRGMGTTCTVLLHKEDKVFIAHVGDSRIYISTDDKLFRVTKDHSFVQKLVDAGQLEDSEMESHPRKNELTSALGISFDVMVEVAENPILPKKGDKFLMCSDGLCGLVNDLTISNTINKTSGLQTVNELIQMAENAGGNDNISVGVIEIVESSHSKTIFEDKTNKKSNKATQVIDLNSMSGDKVLAFCKKNMIYIFSLLTILVSFGVFIIINNNGNTPPPSTPTPTPPNIDIETNINCEDLDYDTHIPGNEEANDFREWANEEYPNLCETLKTEGGLELDLKEGKSQFTKDAWEFEHKGSTLGCQYLNSNRSRKDGNFPQPIKGCTDDTACNFNPDATDFDDSCKYDLGCGCGKPAAEEGYDCDGVWKPIAKKVYGCKREGACNYNADPNVSEDNDLCIKRNKKNCKKCDGSTYIDDMVMVCLDKDGDRYCETSPVKICKYNFAEKKKEGYIKTNEDYKTDPCPGDRYNKCPSHDKGEIGGGKNNTDPKNQDSEAQEEKGKENESDSKSGNTDGKPGDKEKKD